MSVHPHVEGFTVHAFVAPTESPECRTTSEPSDASNPMAWFEARVVAGERVL